MHWRIVGAWKTFTFGTPCLILLFIYFRFSAFALQMHELKFIRRVIALIIIIIITSSGLFSQGALNHTLSYSSHSRLTWHHNGEDCFFIHCKEKWMAMYQGQLKHSLVSSVPRNFFPFMIKHLGANFLQQSVVIVF